MSIVCTSNTGRPDPRRILQRLERAENADRIIYRTEAGTFTPIIHGLAVPWHKRRLIQLPGRPTHWEYFVLGAFRETIGLHRIEARINHKENTTFADTADGGLTLEETPAGLAYEMRPQDTPAGRGALLAVRQCRARGASVLFKKSAWPEMEPGESFPVCRQTCVELIDVSIAVDVAPQYPTTTCFLRWEKLHHF